LTARPAAAHELKAKLTQRNSETGIHLEQWGASSGFTHQPYVSWHEDSPIDALSTDQIEELHRDLLALREEVVALLALSSEGARPVDLEEPIGRLSRMDAMQQQSMLQANRRAAQMRQQQTEAALQRLRDKEYGECRECGEHIGYPRLKARPEAPLCLACQGLREKRG